MNKKVRFIMPCHGLHDYGGHEYMYTKGIKDNLPNSYDCVIWGRKDVTDIIKQDLNVEPIFSKVYYNQEQNIFLKACKLIIREFRWHKEIKKAIESEKNNNYETIIFVHTFSLYSIWSWIFLIKEFRKNNIRLLLILRYSKILLPRFLQNIYIALCKMLPKSTKRLVYFTDSRLLAKEYKELADIDLNVLPVMAKTESKNKIFDFNIKKNLILSYLGCARNDKGFYHLPDIIKKINSHAFDYKIKIKIQSSTPGTDYLEEKCSKAIIELKKIQNKSSNEIILLEDRLDDKEYDELLYGSNVILLPYVDESYKVQTSGILIEAMSAGIPCIVPQDTWMHEQIMKTGGGISFNPLDNNSISNSVIELIKHFERYNKLAKESMDVISENNGPKAQTEELIGYINKSL